MITLIPLTLLSLLPILASTATDPSTAIVYQTSTLTFTVAAATSYLTTATSASSPASATSSLSPTSPAAAPSTPPSTAQYASDPTFQAAILNSTTAYRTAYNATPLTWNTTLATYASTYASKCLFAHSRGPYGENIAETYPNVTAAVEGWGGEGRMYDWGRPGFGEGTGHFTQLVWRGTESVGCGRVDCDGNSVGGNATGWLVVCEYYPPGNVDGEYQANVDKERVKCFGSGGGTAGSEVQEVCAKFSGAERIGRGWGFWSWQSVVVGGAWMVVRAVL